jgi:hypothetical protein
VRHGEVALAPIPKRLGIQTVSFENVDEPGELPGVSGLMVRACSQT